MDVENRDSGSMETKARQPRLFYHGIGEPARNKAQLLEEFGLIGEADVPTLSPSLEVVSQYIDLENIFVTFWYPDRTGTSKQSIRNYAAPTTPLPPEVKEQAIARVNSSDYTDDEKARILEYIGKATTYLPPTQLGAIAKFRMRDFFYLSDALPQDSRVIDDYVSQKTELKDYLTSYLDKLDIKFISPNLDRSKLAEDMIKTTLEHYMLHLGSELSEVSAIDNSYNLAIRLNKLKGEIENLEQVSFSEPVYERYRRLLTSKYSRLRSRIGFQDDDDDDGMS